ncbi:protein YLS9-like [Pyrus ussuriensis x Pyrus communis]|uniref:Protein YLS9-like n=1 Tax=Pyrus ussuriensis x Pyrus communis TaxID=2448454 RepID=A0A5N5F692_9ROSA|nr:protein YLS9-like [Pyrus ussuriensis x Pyrus communis]
MSKTESPDIENTGGGVQLFLFVLFAGMFVLVMSRRHTELYKVPEFGGGVLLFLFVLFTCIFSEFTVVGADVSQFNYTKVNHTLSYNLTLNITLTNPNNIIYFQLSDIQVIAPYQNNRVGLVTLMNGFGLQHWHGDCFPRKGWYNMWRGHLQSKASFYEY